MTIIPPGVMLTALEVTRVASIYPDAAVHISRAILAERNKYVWQSIDTAPKDGTIIDLYTSMGVVCLNEWWIEDDGEAFWSCDFDDRFVTHWRPVMPLPSLPEPSTKPPIKEAAES